MTNMTTTTIAFDPKRAANPRKAAPAMPTKATGMGQIGSGRCPYMGKNEKGRVVFSHTALGHLVHWGRDSGLEIDPDQLVEELIL
jgi:hypothetical protein